MTDTTPPVTAELQTLADAIGHDVSDVKTAIEASKTGGKAAFIAALPNLVIDAKATYEDVKAALPQIKAGYQTTEFWLTAGLCVGNAVYAGVTGKVLPFDLNVVLGGVIAVYTAIRGLVKKPTT